MPKKPLPQFNSLAEALAFYKQYGELIPGGRINEKYLYTYKVKDGREMRMYFYLDGRVEELKFEKTSPTYVYQSDNQEKRESDRNELIKFVKNGICECKAAGRFRWRVVGGKRVYMCVKCERPVYYKM